MLKLNEIADMAKCLGSIESPVVQDVDRHVRSGEMFAPAEWHTRIAEAEAGAEAPKGPESSTK